MSTPLDKTANMAKALCKLQQLSSGCRTLALTSCGPYRPGRCASRLSSFDWASPDLSQRTTSLAMESRSKRVRERSTGSLRRGICVDERVEEMGAWCRQHKSTRIPLTTQSHSAPRRCRTCFQRVPSLVSSWSKALPCQSCLLPSLLRVVQVGMGCGFQSAKRATTHRTLTSFNFCRDSTQVAETPHFTTLFQYFTQHRRSRASSHRDHLLLNLHTHDSPFIDGSLAGSPQACPKDDDDENIVPTIDSRSVACACAPPPPPPPLDGLSNDPSHGPCRLRQDVPRSA